MRPLLHGGLGVVLVVVVAACGEVSEPGTDGAAVDGATDGTPADDGSVDGVAVVDAATDAATDAVTDASSCIWVDVTACNYPSATISGFCTGGRTPSGQLLRCPAGGGTIAQADAAYMATYYLERCDQTACAAFNGVQFAQVECCLP